MEHSRRQLLALGAGGVAAGIGVGTVVADDALAPFRVRSTVGTVPTTDRYFGRQPSLDEVGALWATIVGVMGSSTLDLKALPIRVADRLDDTEDGAFWVAAGAVLPPEIEFSLGRGRFHDGVLRYDVTRYEDRIGSSESWERDDESQDPLYHYKFQQWTPDLPFADVPSRVDVAWDSAD